MLWRSNVCLTGLIMYNDLDFLFTYVVYIILSSLIQVYF